MRRPLALLMNVTQADFKPPFPARVDPRQADPPSMDRGRRDGIRDTLESIIIAFILAFVFRAFMVEAFVIPTGSMAPGLNGAHAQHRCSLCRYPFAYGLREDIRLQGNQGQPGTLSVAGFSVRCPNCGNKDGGNSRLNTPENPVVAESGDRILVLKWPFDIGGDLLGPRRWDVVVFKDPEDGETNFIKRLIGLPGEVVQLIDGDLFTAPIDDVPTDIRETLSKPPTMGGPDARRLSPDQFDRLARVLRIQRKTRVAQDALWMLHYEHDFVPGPMTTSSPNFHPPAWQPESAESGWNAATPRVTFTPKGTGEEWLRLVGKPIQDAYGYNDISAHPTVSPRNVGDVLLKLALFPQAATGHVKFYLSRGSHEFVATLEAGGDVILHRIGQGGVPIELQRNGKRPLVPGEAVEVELENLDYRVALRINGEEVVATSDAQYQPDPVALVRDFGLDDGRNAARVRIGAQGMPLEIRHLAVYRDIYYRSDQLLEDGNMLTRRRNPLAGLPGWATTLNPVLLRKEPADYFCLGDNSPQSKDGRMWWEACPMLEQRGDYNFGTVPGDQLIGRAFFVYWPSGFRFSRETPAVIPNVGRMRIIR